MHRFLKTLIPICLLGSSACINVPDVEPPDTGNTPDSGTPQKPAGDFALTIDPAQASVIQGGSQSLQLSLSRTGGFTDSVTVHLVNPPAGLSAQPVTISASSTSATLTVAVGPHTEPGPKTLTVRGTAGALTQEVSVSLTVTRQGDLAVQWASPSQSKVYVKDSLSLQVAVEGGTAETVDLYKGTVFLTRLSAPSYQYTWDTSQEAAGEYQLTARATRAGATFTSPVRTIVVDHTAPTVATRTPAPGAAFVSVRDTIQVSFDEALKGSSVTDASVVLSTESASNIAKTLSLSMDGKTLTLTPNAPLSLPANVTITLGTATAPLTDLAGNALSPSSAWSFTLPAWLPLGGAISAVAGNTAAENVAMKVGTDGNPVIAWSESDGSTKNIYAWRWTGANWEPIGNALSAVSGTGTDADKPALLLDAENRPVIVWTEKMSGDYNTNLYGSRWTGTSWENLPAFGLGPDDRRSNASIAFDNKGGILVANHGVIDFSQKVELFRLDPSSTAWESLSGGIPSYEAPQFIRLATDTSGNWYIAICSLEWDSTKEYRSISVLKKEPHTSWIKLGNSVTSPAQSGCVSASLTVGGNNQPSIIWEEGNAPTSNVHTAFWNGLSWQMRASTVHTSTTSNQAPSLSLGNDGNPIVTWSGYSSPEQSIWVSRWNGISWQQMGSRLSAATGVSTAGFRPILVLDQNGWPLVAWHESDSSVSNVHVYRYNY